MLTKVNLFALDVLKDVSYATVSIKQNACSAKNLFLYIRGHVSLNALMGTLKAFLDIVARRLYKLTSK